VQGGGIDEELETATIIGSPTTQTFDKVEPALNKAEEAARGFSSVFSNAFEDAIFSTDSLTDSITALGEELARVALRVAVIEPIARSLGTSLGGGLFGSTTAAADGAVISGTGTRGGFINKPTIIPMAAGGVLAGEAGREAILPLTRMASGKLGVETEGGGSGADVQIIDQRGASAPDLQRRTVNGPGGREQLQLVIRQEVTGMFADGSVDPLLGAFGTRRPGTRRG
jgi:phage-related minor tail protein